MRMTIPLQGSWSHSRGWIPSGRFHRGVDDGCHSGVLRLPATGENTWVKVIANERKHLILCVLHIRDPGVSLIDVQFEL